MAANDELTELIAEGETFTVEFKGEERKHLNDTDLVESVVCLANGDGGTLLVGVEDDGRVTGARARHEAGTTDIARLTALIANKTQPAVRCTITQVELSGLSVLVIAVPDEPRAVGTTDGKYIRRAIGGDGRPSCIPMQAADMLAAEIDRGARDFASIDIPDATWEDLDPLEFERLRRMVRENRGRADAPLAELSDIDVARALSLVGGDYESPTIRAGALLLFGRDEALARFIPPHEVAFQVLEDTRVVINEFQRSPLLRVAEDVFARFRARNATEEIEDGLLRVSVPAYPEASFVEAMANALVHRDYTRLGAVHVQWHPDRIEISNPGGFPPGVTVDNVLVAAPRPRNPLLADAFKRVGLVDRVGRGVNRIYEGQARFGRPLPDYSRTSRDDVIVSIPGGPANLALAKFVAEQDASRSRPVPFAELILVNELVHRRTLDAGAAAAILQTSEDDARRQLRAAAEHGLVEARGTRRPVFHLSAPVYRALGEAPAYVRARGFETLQQEQMILQYVDSHDAITRRAAADLCRVPPREARQTLKRLVDRGELVVVGERRTARYERP